MWQPVLFEKNGARACMACGRIQWVSATEWVASPDPNGSTRLPSRLLTLDADTAAWLSEWPRAVTGVTFEAPGPLYLPASFRAQDTAHLAAAARELATDPFASLTERLRAAGVPGPPRRRNMRYEVAPYLAAHDALGLSVDAPLERILELTVHDTPVVRTLAAELLAKVPAIFATLTAAIVNEADTPLPRPLALAALMRLVPSDGGEQASALAASLGRRLERLVPGAAEHEIEIDALVDALRSLGPVAARCEPALSLLEGTDLARRRSALRQEIERARRAMRTA
jgi:hypothetical protein